MYDRVNCTKYETCAILHRFHILHISREYTSKQELSHAFLEVFLRMKYTVSSFWKVLALCMHLDFRYTVVMDGKCILQGSHRLKKYLNIQDCLEKSLKIKVALKGTLKTLKGLGIFLNFTIYRRIQQCFWRPKSV